MQLRRARQYFRFGLVLLGLSVLVVYIANLNFPFFNSHNAKPFSTVVLADDGRVLRAFADEDGIWRQHLSLDDVSENYLQVLLAYEDRWFYSHFGINPVASMRALWQNLRCRCVRSGGSTLSMQVARIFHPHSRTLRGKFYQMLRALQLEMNYSKREILAFYINYAPFGGVVEGVQAASAAYLDKTADDLTDAEAALLVVLPQSPSRIRPDRHQQAATLARNKVIDRMVALGDWHTQRAELAKLEVVASQLRAKPRYAPLLARQLKKSHPNQMRISTTIDYDLQVSLERYLHDHVQTLAKKTSVAAMVVENKTGRVRAYIGSADFADSSRFGHVDMVTGLRSPGSSLKPFIYGLALDQGHIHSASLLLNTPRYYGEYQPSNYNQAFTGPVSATAALQTSLNLPAVQLLEQISPEAFYYYLKNLGIKLRFAGKPSLAIALGGVGINLWQLVSLYHGLANGGQMMDLSVVHHQPLMHKSPLTAQAQSSGRYLMSPGSAWVIYNMLSSAKRPDRISGSMIYGQQNTLAWKTGTSYGARDAWALGFNADYTLGIWVGRPDGTASPGHLGAQTALPLLFSIADSLGAGHGQIAQPSSVKSVPVCWPLGQAKSHTLAAHCHQTHDAYIIDQQIPPTLSVQGVNSTGLNPLTIWLDPQNSQRVNKHCMPSGAIKQSIALWPRVAEPWVPKHWRLHNQLPPSSLRCRDPVASVSHSLSIAKPEQASSYQLLEAGSVIPIKLQALGGQGKITWYSEGEVKGTSVAGEVLLMDTNVPGQQQIVAVDQLGNIDRVSIFIRPGIQR